MMTKIEWTNETWNISAGCTKMTDGCKNCYAEKMAKRLQAVGVKGYENGFDFNLMPWNLDKPEKIKKPSMIFVNSMSDLFHEEMPYDYLEKVFDVINKNRQHTFQILTKRYIRMYTYFLRRPVPDNIWVGVSISDKSDIKLQLTFLRNIRATVKFVSFEPLLANVGDIYLNGIDWVIVGGESGSNGRQMKKEWVLNIKRQCDEQGVPFFFKQWGTWGEDGKKRSKRLNGRMLNGKVYDAMPEIETELMDLK
jgi:protein gp37